MLFREMVGNDVRHDHLSKTSTIILSLLVCRILPENEFEKECEYNRKCSSNVMIIGKSRIE